MSIPYDSPQVEETGALSSPMGNFGDSFKKARESKGVSVDRIAAETRISTRFLLAIENEEFNLLPGGIFNRGFVRTYAEKVGLDPDQAVVDYERLVRMQEPAETSAIPRSGKRERHLYPLAIAGLGIVILIFYLVTKETSNTAQTVSTAAPPPAPAVTVPEPAPAITAPAPAPPQPAPPAAPSAPLTQPPTTPPAVTSAAPETQPLAAAKESLRIDIEATETTWIRVEADGMTVDAGENMEPGTTRHFTAKNSIVLAIGNAAGLTLKINDMPVKNLGRSGQVRELNITPENVKSFL